MTIREARKNAGLTQAQLAQYLNVSKRAVEEWEAGNKAPTKYSECEIVHRLEVLTIFTGEGQEALLDGTISFEEAEREYKIHMAKETARCGRYGTTFEKYLSRIPEGVFEALTGDQVGEMINALEDAYNAGVQHGLHEEA